MVECVFDKDVVQVQVLKESNTIIQAKRVGWAGLKRWAWVSFGTIYHMGSNPILSELFY